MQGDKISDTDNLSLDNGSRIGKQSVIDSRTIAGLEQDIVGKNLATLVTL